MAVPRKTVTQLLLDVRTNLDETTAAFFTDARLISYLDQAQHLVWATVKSLKADYFDVTRLSTDGSATILGASYATSSFAIVAGTTSYTLPPDLAELKSIEVITSGYESVQFTHMDRASPPFQASKASATTNQSPSGFYFDIIGEATLLITPPSDTALDLRLIYTPILDTLTTGTDVIQTPHPLWLAIVDMATARAQMMDHDPYASVWHAAAEETIRRFMMGHARQTQDTEAVADFF